MAHEHVTGRIVYDVRVSGDLNRGRCERLLPDFYVSIPATSHAELWTIDGSTSPRDSR
jgi:hypothetical protein